MEKQQIKQLMDFIQASPTAYQMVATARGLLKDQGFKELALEEAWELEPGQAYFTTINDSALLAFRLGLEEGQGFRIIGSHSDSPGFKVKPQAPAQEQGNYRVLATDVYGGPIISTWLDRPLKLAGRVLVRGENAFHPWALSYVQDRDFLIIPNVAIHLNREINKGFQYDLARDTFPIYGLGAGPVSEDLLLERLAEDLDLDAADILDYDLFLAPVEGPMLLGENQELISSYRLDNLAMAQASLAALLASSASPTTQLVAILDKEEVGSTSRDGADSPSLAMVLARICQAQKSSLALACPRSFMLSADMSHAIHPARPEWSDPVNYPVLNQGPVIKSNPRLSYTTDGQSAAVFKELCRQAQVPYQVFTDRSGSRGGSTIGPITASHLGLPSVDIGNPMLAMHSIRELAGVQDHAYIYRVFLEFFS